MNAVVPSPDAAHESALKLFVVELLFAMTSCGAEVLVDVFVSGPFIFAALPPLTPQHATSVEVGSEDRIAVYAQRFARGEALFHCDDISHYNNGEQL